MRRVKDQDDAATLKLLENGVEAAAGKSEIDKKFAQLSDQVRMLQYALGNVFKTLGDFPNVKSQIDQLDYRTLGIARAMASLSFPTPTGPSTPLGETFQEAVEKYAREAKVDAFNELSSADDEQKKFTVADDEAVTDQHWIILTSSCAEDQDQGIFRSKIEVGGEEFKDLKDSFIGKKVGDVVEAKIRGRDHSVTILSLRNKPDASKTV